MILLPLAWTLLTVSLWTSGSSEILQEEVKILYPAILDTVAIECACTEIHCNSVYWFRSIPHRSTVQFLGRCNNAGFPTYANGLNSTRFKFIRKSTSFTLSIFSVTEEDTGIYSCVLKDRNQEEMWKPGIFLKPGGTPPTLPPPVTKRKPPVKPLCRCPKKNSPQGGCGSLVLWPLVGFIAALALALICTLYYFSRLPKKCRHHFVKKR